LVAPFTGRVSAGVDGDGRIVVKLKLADQALVPPALAAQTRQKYLVLLARPATTCAADVNPLRLETMEPANVESVETWSEYEVTDVMGDHVKVTDVGWFIAWFKGEAGVGLAGTATIVVIEYFVDHALVPPEFVALTRQK
jgi:hypothetical protein